MKKIFILHTLDTNHFCSNGLILETSKFDINYNLFKKFNYNIIFLKDFTNNITNPNLDLQSNAIINLLNYLKTIKNEKIFIYCISHGFYSILFDENIKHNKNIIKIIFTDDPHAYFLTDTKLHKKSLFYDKNLENPFMGPAINSKLVNPSIDFFDYVLTPSKTFFENINYIKMNNIFQYNYCINENDLIIKNSCQKKNKILLSGAINDNIYKLRKIINDNINMGNNEYINIFEKLDHCGYDNTNNTKISGYKYLLKISEYKGAIADNTIFPLGYSVYKHIEILFSGSLGFFLEDVSLYEKLGLKKYEHYIPVYIDEINNTITNFEEIKFYLNSNEHYNKIRLNGQKYILENFNTLVSSQKFLNYIIDNKIYYQTNIDVTLKLLKLGKSFIRFGDEDFLLLMNKSVITQTTVNDNLINEMKDILLNKNDNIMIGLPPWFLNYYDYHYDTEFKKENEHYQKFFEKHKNFIEKYITRERIYHDSCIFRPFKIENYKNLVYNSLKEIIENKKIFLICNHNTTLNHPFVKLFFANVNNIDFAYVDNINAYNNNYIDIINIIQNNINHIDIILIAASPMRVIVNKFTNKQIIDIGSFFGIF